MTDRLISAADVSANLGKWAAQLKRELSYRELSTLILCVDNAPTVLTLGLDLTPPVAPTEHNPTEKLGGKYAV